MSASYDNAPLASQAAVASERALACGALQPIASTCEIVKDRGVGFAVRTTSAPAAKTPSAAPVVNPFLPYHPAVFVADLSPTHVCLLNKYSVVPGHLLVVTRDFERQDSPLSLADFRAWIGCLEGFDEAVGFYNSGPLAGASQPHKHLQIAPYAPCSIEESSASCWPPMAALWEECDAPSATVSSCLAWPLIHRLARLPDLDAIAVHSLYHQMLAELAQAAPEAIAHNAILTRRWLVVIPRRRDSFHGLGMNGLSYAGAILARGEEQRRDLLAAGPMAALLHGAFK